MNLSGIIVAWLLAAGGGAGSPQWIVPAALPSPPSPTPPPHLSPGATGACPVGPDRSCVLDLKGATAPEVPRSCLTHPWPSHMAFEQPSKLSNADGDLWWETVVRINLDPSLGCGCAVFRVTYEEAPSGFTVDIGDSPTNDGWGGDAGTTRWSAEVNVEKETVSVFSDSTGKKVDQILALSLPDLAGRTLTLKVCDESLSFELDRRPSERQSLLGTLSSLTFQHLFALGGQAVSGDPAGSRIVDYSLHAAFNRVIHVRGGPPAKGRIGTGARRAEIYLTP